MKFNINYSFSRMTHRKATGIRALIFEDLQPARPEGVSESCAKSSQVVGQIVSQAHFGLG